MQLFFVTLFTLFLIWLPSKGVELMEAKLKESKKAQGQPRKKNGQFKKLVKKPQIEVTFQVAKEKRIIPINYMGQTIDQIVL